MEDWSSLRPEIILHPYQVTRYLAVTDEACRDINREYDKINSDGEDDMDHETETDGVTSDTQ